MKKLTFLAIAVAFFSASAVPVHADTPLHGFCWGATPACTDNGTNTPTSKNPPNFGFTISSGPTTGDFLIEVLVPNTVSNPSGLSFSITGTQGGPSNTLPLSGTATLFSTTAWTSGQLDSYLGISASPANPNGAFLPSTQSLNPAATGFYVYEVDLGTNRLQDVPNPLLGPLLTMNTTLPLASYIVGFLSDSSGFFATANSGAIFETGRGRTPEPSSIFLLGAGLTGLGLWAWRKKKN